VKALTGSVGLSPASDLCGQSILHQGTDEDCQVLSASSASGPARPAAAAIDALPTVLLAPRHS
jgi:hypothetical protein